MEWFLKHFKNLSFRRKLILSYLVVIVVPIMTLGIYSYSLSRSFLLEQAKQRLDNIAKQYADSVESKIQDSGAAIDFFTFNSGIFEIFNKEYIDYFEMYKDLNQIIDPMFTTTLNTNRQIRQLTVYTGNNITERRYSIMTIERVKDTAWYGEVMKDRQLHWFYADEKVFAARRLLDQRKSNIPNLIYMELDTGIIFDSIQNDNSYEFGAVIVDSKGTEVFSKNTMEGVDLKPEKKEEAEWEKGVDLVMKVISGKDMILIKKPVSTPAWTLYYYVPINSIVLDAGKIVKATVAIAGACIVFLGLMTWVFSRTFVKRIENLNKKMDAVEKGDLKIEVESRSMDEIGQLTNKFGKMLKNINLLIDEVYHGKIIQKEAELKALQAQINPHFLYNTLSMINWKALRIGAEDISEITTNMSTFYRTILNKGKNTIPVRNELENTRAYVDIQRRMHNDGFDIYYDIDDRVCGYEMLNIILQPIVENAIEHGIDGKRVGRGELRIGAHIAGENIEFTVSDNGPGMLPEMVEQVFVRQTAGYGLKNADERLKLYFGEQYGVTVSSTPGEGTLIKVVIPICPVRT